MTEHGRCVHIIHVAREIEVFANRAACAGPEDERNGASLAYWNVGDAGVLHDGKIWRHIEARYVKRNLSGTVERHRADRADSANCSVGEAQRETTAATWPLFFAPAASPPDKRQTIASNPARLRISTPFPRTARVPTRAA